MKLTDEQVKYALECCTQGVYDCKKECPLRDNGCSLKLKCRFGLCKDALDLINRQKAEIERLEKILNKRCDVCPAVITKITEFAERLKEMATSTFFEERKYVDTEDIDNLVKEMVGDTDV